MLVLEDDRGIAAIAPLALARRSAGPLRYRALEVVGTGALRFLGMGLADRADLLLARRREECVREVLAWLAARREDWHVLDLRFLPEDSTTARVLAAEAAALGMGIAHEPCSESPYLALDGGYDAYLARRSRNFRKGLKRKLARLEEMGEVGFRLDAADADPEAALAAAVEVSLASWKEEAGSALLLHQRVHRFFALLVPRLQARRRFYVALLTVGGKVAAHELGFRLAGKLWSYDSAFKREFEDGSPGALLTARVLAGAFAEGLREYDFLRGNEGYKRTWETASRREVQLVLDSGAPLGRAAREVAFRAKWALKRRPELVAAQALAVGVLNRWIERGRRPHA